MRLRTIRNPKQLRGKRVLVRIDANVPVKAGRAIDGTQGKIARAAVDLEWLRQHGARLVVVTHLGRPDGKRTSAYSVQPIARRLEALLGDPVRICRDIVGPKAEKMAASLKDGEVMLLENIRFLPGEEGNSKALAQQLAHLADVYVNDAFAVSHRAHASVDAITEELPSYAGPLLSHEVDVLESLHKPRRPFLLVMGGLKMSTKLPVLERFLPVVDQVIIGGALAHPFLLADKQEIGASVYDKEGVSVAKALLKKWRHKLILPTDAFVVRRPTARARPRQTVLHDLKKDEMIVDVGRRTMRAYVRVVQEAKTIVWNGPLGYCEVPKFCAGSHLLGRAIAARTGRATTVVGGGDTLPVIESAGLVDRYTLVSTGGGAMLEFLAGASMPGLEALKS